MKKSILMLFGLALAAACSHPAPEAATGRSVPDLGWLFLEEGPYTLQTKVQAAPGPATFSLVTDLSLMADTPEVVLQQDVTVEADSTVSIGLGMLEPGFYQVRLRDSVRFNIGVKPDRVVSGPDARPDFGSFWQATFSELAQVPPEAEFTVVPEYSNDLRTCYEVRFPSWGGGVAGGILSVPTADGTYPVWIQYMGYGAEPFYFDPSSAPERIDFLVSVRDQGIFTAGQDRWIDRGLSSKETFYYRGAYADAKQALEFIFSYPKADASRVVISGESQGGALATVAASSDSRVRALALAVPFMGDFRDYARIVWWPVHEVFQQADVEGIDRETLFTMLSYFDVKNFAPGVTCPVRMAFGLQDPTCPPHTNFSIYNNLGTSDRQFFCVPTCGHAMWMEDSWSRERDAFFAGFLN